MKRIIFFVGSLNNSGGTERVATLIANSLSDKGYHVSFLSLHDGDKPFFLLNPEIQFESLFPHKLTFKKHYFSVVRKLRHYLKQSNSDILINVESMLTLFAVPACTRLGIRNICWEHFNYFVDNGTKLRILARKVAAFCCNDVITLTGTDKKYWIENTICRANIISIQNPSPFELKGPKEKVNSKCVISAGRLTYQKGFDLLLRAWAIVIQSRSDWKLRIIGSGEDEKKLRDLCTQLAINNNVDWAGHVNDMNKEYQYTDLYVMSSRYEGLPMVLLEAQSFGIPIVSFDCRTGPAEIINSRCGWLCEDGSVVDLAKKLLEAFSLFEEAEQYHAYSKAAITQCADKFALPHIIEKWQNLLEER